MGVYIGRYQETYTTDGMMVVAESGGIWNDYKGPVLIAMVEVDPKN